MKRWILMLAAGLLAPAAVLGQQVVRQRAVTLQLDVNAQGRVTADRVMGPPQKTYMMKRDGYKAFPSHAKPLPEVFAKAAEKIAMHWRFKALVVQGKPVSGRTWAAANLQVVKQAGGTYGVRLQYKRNGPYISRPVAPWYPRHRSQPPKHYAIVFLRAEVRPDNSVTDIHVVKVYTDGRAEASRAFAQAAKEAVKHWKALAEHVNGRAVPTHLDIPIEFRLGGQFESRAGEDSLMKRARLDMRVKYGYVGQGSPLVLGQALAKDSPFVKQPSS